MFGKAAIPVLVLAAGALVPMAPSAAASTQSVPDCVGYAVDEGDAEVDVAFQACTQGSLLDCYRTFRDEYGRQEWALEACKLRD
ncbi:hypothetical protein [Amycolatopsis samaneae]|uniref:Uncharacterized protein n=1 Tax=Amycolatopsis samaneae TaxID=664691 RepID=A0ABW5GE21_9PSEU